MIMDNSVIREILADALGMLRYKVEQGTLTPEDMETIMEVFRAGGGIQATAQDLAGYYRRSEDDIRHLIHRNIFPAPRRRVYYDFAAFQRLVPERWRKKGR